ncbi:MULTISPECIES: DHA2 family efflux MFS transporter permease subunit [unclassified Bradyrhizobium]|uniref:DHA2 family efflux MFS transporter permease subunit n=1 Tax=unclassified Bradyrhizobium TaxID=2631580 RepID=UPI0024787F3F|nr:MULTISPECIES: DHA2 family efflux MFS transporter permease subunit [unclassified Bradyrhizobium]WGS21342.1 DHA2 family efflux MFS transporter permease subunit [Bradyrhizobium sp. ISRA463]WGS28271.1 DHA2 family efflux MFS transporter permease subunit [Bradyrhizobium sp. ISRA464]
MQTPIARAEQLWVLGVTALASFMMALDAMIITTAFATIRADFGSAVETLQWTVSAFNLTFAVLLLTGAALGDRFGRSRMFAAGIALFIVASAACALAGNAQALIAARALQGAGAAFVMPLAMAILSGAFGREERARALGIFSSITGCALIVGPAIGGFITTHLGWRWIFWINLPIGLIVIALVLTRLRESFGPAAPLDITGLSLVAAAALALVWSLLRGNAVGWASAEVMGTLAAGAVFAAGFVLWELRTATPMLPMRLFASRAFASGMAASVLFYAAMYGVLFLLPQFLQTTLSFDAFSAGLRLLPWTATLFVTAPVAGAVVNRFGERPLVVTGLLMQAIGLGWISEIVSPTIPYADLVAPLVLAGVGVSMAMPAAQNAVLSSVSVTEIGKASGAFNMGRFLGGMFGIAALVAEFSANGAADSAVHFESGFAAAMSLAATLSLAGAAAGFILPARQRAMGAAAPQDA